MSRIFYETIIDLIDVQISNSMNLKQVEELGKVLKDDKQAIVDRLKVVSLLKLVIEKCNTRQDKLGITDYLNGILFKFEKGE